MMRSSRVVGLVAAREIRERIRTRSFIVSTIVIALLLIVAVVLPTVLGDDGGSDSYVLGVVGGGLSEEDAARAGLAAAAGGRVELRTFEDARAAEAAISEGTADVALLGRGEVLVRERDPDSTAGRLATTVASSVAATERLRQAGIDPEPVLEALGGPPLPIRALEPENRDREQALPVVYIALILIYMSVITYGTWVALGVTEEKSTRVVEVLLPAIRPYQLMAGKIVGIGSLALAQLVVVTIPALVAASLTDLSLPAASVVTVAAALMWFVLGFVFYACAYAAAGALASRQEDVQNVTFPMTTLLVFGFIVGIQSLSDPDTLFVRVLSFVPPFAPVTMLSRAALGDVAPWEVALSAFLTALGAYLVVRLAGRIYMGAILRTGGRVKVRDALRAAAGR